MNDPRGWRDIGLAAAMVFAAPAVVYGFWPFSEGSPSKTAEILVPPDTLQESLPDFCPNVPVNCTGLICVPWQYQAGSGEDFNEAAAAAIFGALRLLGAKAGVAFDGDLQRSKNYIKTVVSSEASDITTRQLRDQLDFRDQLHGTPLEDLPLQLLSLSWEPLSGGKLCFSALAGATPQDFLEMRHRRKLRHIREAFNSALLELHRAPESCEQILRPIEAAARELSAATANPEIFAAASGMAELSAAKLSEYRLVAQFRHDSPRLLIIHDPQGRADISDVEASAQSLGWSVATSTGPGSSVGDIVRIKTHPDVTPRVDLAWQRLSQAAAVESIPIRDIPLEAPYEVIWVRRTSGRARVMHWTKRLNDIASELWNRIESPLPTQSDRAAIAVHLAPTPPAPPTQLLGSTTTAAATIVSMSSQPPIPPTPLPRAAVSDLLCRDRGDIGSPVRAHIRRQDRLRFMADAPAWMQVQLERPGGNGTICWVYKAYLLGFDSVTLNKPLALPGRAFPQCLRSGLRLYLTGRDAGSVKVILPNNAAAEIQLADLRGIP